MLSAAQRLRRRGEFAAAVRTGRRAARGVLVVHLASPVRDRSLSAAGTGVAGDRAAEGRARPSRAGFIVSKAVGGAVVRNKVKRRLRELVRHRLTALPAGTDIVVRALPGAANRPYTELTSDLDAALAAAARRRPRSEAR